MNETNSKHARKRYYKVFKMIKERVYLINGDYNLRSNKVKDVHKSIHLRTYEKSSKSVISHIRKSSKNTL